MGVKPPLLPLGAPLGGSRTILGCPHFQQPLPRRSGLCRQGTGSTGESRRFRAMI